MQAHDDVRRKVPIWQLLAEVGEVHVIPEGGTIFAVVQQRRGNVLALLKRQVQAFSLSIAINRQEIGQFHEIEGIKVNQKEEDLL